MRMADLLPLNNNLQFIGGSPQYRAGDMGNGACFRNDLPYFPGSFEYYSESDMTAFSTIDGTIMRALQQEGRLTNVELARKVNLSPSACLRRVQLLEQGGAID